MFSSWLWWLDLPLANLDYTPWIHLLVAQMVASLLVVVGMTLDHMVVSCNLFLNGSGFHKNGGFSNKDKWWLYSSSLA